MRHLLLIFLLLSVFLTLFGEVVVENKQNGLSVELTFANQNRVFSNIFAVHSKEVKLEIGNITADVYTKNNEYVGTANEKSLPVKYEIDDFVMRELFAHKITIDSEIETADNIYKIKEIKFSLEPVGTLRRAAGISSVFLPIYKQIVCNFDKSYLRDQPLASARMAIVTSEYLVEYLDDFLAWKHEKGIYTDVYTLNETGNTSTEIKNFLQTKYDNPATKPDYILIIGDVDDTFAVPAFYYSAENNVSDNPYALYAGDDFIPDVLVGRISIDSTIELATVFNKIYQYEKTPYMGNTDWFNSALLVAGNYSSTPPVPSTPVTATRWLADKMVNYGFNNITQVYYPPTYPGTSQIISAIDNGVSFVTYRGWGDANGWHYPYFHVENIDELNNGARLPVMTSIVCNTGDFANSVDPCFGEKWIRAGTPSQPKGGVIFVGPSDLHTNTKFNNAIFSGFYTGLLDEDNYTFGADLLRGKMELYNNYPLNMGEGGRVEFYFYVYNTLGDPSLMMWSRIPETIDCSLPSSITVGTNNIDINVSADLDGGVATVLHNSEIIDVKIIENSSTILYLDNLDTSNVLVTVTKPNFVPFLQEITVNNPAVDLGIETVTTNSDLIAGENNDINITLKNFGSGSASNVVGILSSTNPDVTIETDEMNFGDIDGGESAVQSYPISLTNECPNGSIIEFSLMLSTGDVRKFFLEANSLSLKINSFVVDDSNGILEPGETAMVNMEVKNTGIINISGLQSEIIAQCDAVTISDPNQNIGNLNIDQTGQFSFEASVTSDCYVGRSARFEFHFTDENGLLTIKNYVITLGDIDNSAPTGPDNFGYFCYDSFDENYSEKPDYFWQEIDPNEGGNGTVILMSDDESDDVDLPFDFTYYGESFSQATICSNGWISLVPTWMSNFRNWGIPAALGPYAMISPYWDDLIGFPDGEEHLDMRICYYHDSTNHTFIVEWNEAYNRFDDASLEKFQLVLYDPAYNSSADGNGEIQFNYHTVNNPDANNNYATIGIESPSQLDGIEYSYANIYPASATELQNEFALKFTTDPPDNYTISENEQIPSPEFELFNNYPNPFNPTTSISFYLARNSDFVEINIYNIKGQKVRTLLNEPLPKGKHTVIWNGNDDQNSTVSSGIYFYKLSVPGKTQKIKKCILMK